MEGLFGRRKAPGRSLPARASRNAMGIFSLGWALALAAGLLLHSWSVKAQGGAASSNVVFTVVPTPNPIKGTRNNNLISVSAASPTDIWAVGQTTIHFDGTKWTGFQAPAMNGLNENSLNGVANLGNNNAYAVGYYRDSNGLIHQLIEHWDGTQWSVMPGAKLPTQDEPFFEGISAISANDIWAVGDVIINNQNVPLHEHFDGTAWTAVLDRGAGGLSFLQAVSAVSTNDVWAVGYSGFANSNSTTLTEHWDGTSWKVVKSPSVGTGANQLNGVVALAADDVWAVGFSTATQQPPPGQFDVPTMTLIEHWDGASWTVVPSPNVGPNSQYQSNKLYGVTAVSPTDLWAFGSFFFADGSGQQNTLLLHWDGTTWSINPSPNPQHNPSFVSDILSGGTVPSPGNVWIVGTQLPFITGGPVQATFVIHTNGG